MLAVCPTDNQYMEQTARFSVVRFYGGSPTRHVMLHLVPT
jgi:hypothetical protein